ncbi:bcl-2-related protein A1 isoform X2 [Equus asinus]|uniref:Bcl-2-related protein A1 n=1 Tax=Equus caballus TaxID=9796 RepID=A0A5F5PUY3_HORSE
MTDCEFGYIHMLAQDYLKYVLQIPQPGSGPSKTSRVLQDIAFSVQNEVEKNLKPCLDNFHVVSIDAARTIFNQVMEKQFEDGIINWGRIMTIFAFEGILIKKLLPERIAPDVDTYKEISYFVAEFITKNTGEWIRQNGGWHFLLIAWCCPDLLLPFPSLSQVETVCESQLGETGFPTDGVGLQQPGTQILLQTLCHSPSRLECELDLVTCFQRRECRKGKQSNSAVEKPGKYYFGKVIKVNIIS